MSASFTEFYLQLFDTRLRAPISDSTGVFAVLTAGTASYATTFSDPLGVTALSTTLPTTMTGGVIRFFIASSVTSVDLVVLTANGQSKYLRAVTPSMGRIDIDPEAVNQRLYVPFLTGLSAAVTTSGFALTQTMLVKDAYCRIFAVGSTTALLSAGTTTGSVTGFLNAIICTVTGWAALTEATTSTVAVNTRGSLLMANAAFARQYHRPANATSGLSIIYQTDVTNTTAATGFIVLEYDRLPTP